MTMDLDTDPPPPPDDLSRPPVNASVNRLAAGAGISLFGVGIGRGLDFVKQIALARLLGPEAFGLYAIGWNILRIIGILAPLGLHNGVIHFATPFQKNEDRAVNSVIARSVLLSFLIGWGITLILLAVAPWLTEDLFHEPEFLPLFRVFALMLPFMGALRVAANASRISQRMIFSVASEEIAQGALNLVLFILLYLFGWQLFGAIIATVLSFAGAFALSLYFLWQLFGRFYADIGRPSVTPTNLLTYSLPTALAGMFGVIISRLDRLFLGYYRPSAEVGVYQAAAQISVIMALVLNAFNMILMPIISEQYHKRDMKQLEELFRINTKWGVYCIAPVVLVIVFAAGDVMTVLFGQAYAAGAVVLVILTMGQLVNIATGATGTILIMTGHQTAWFRLSMLIMVANISLNLTLIPRWGMVGAAVATSTTVGGLFALGLLIVYHIHRIWPYDRRYLKGVAAAAVTAVVLFLIRLIGLPPFPNLLITSLAAVATFFALLVKLGLEPEDRAFIETIVSRARSR